MNLSEINWHDSPIQRLSFNDSDLEIELKEFGTLKPYILKIKDAESINVRTEDEIDLGEAEIGSLKLENGTLKIDVVGCTKGFMDITVVGGTIELKET